MKLLINGKIKEQKKSAIDTGYFYGYGVFETILVREGVPVLAQAHLERLNSGLEKIRIKKTVTEEDLTYAISMLRCYNSALKVNVSEANTVFSVRSLAYTAEHYQVGAKLMISDVFRNPSSPSVYLKSMNYMDNILEMQKAKATGWQDVLFINYKQEVCETAVANIFFVKDQQLITPGIGSGLLNGVVRHWLMGQTEVEERTVMLSELDQMQGAFITNSLLGIMKVSAIGDFNYEDHPIIHELTKKYVGMLKETVSE